MKFLTTLSVLFFSAIQLVGQAPPPRKLVEIKSTSPDSVVKSKIKRNKSGQIIEFFLEIKNRDGLTIHSENYVKGEKWVVYDFVSSRIDYYNFFTPEGLLDESRYETSNDTTAIEMDDRYRSYQYDYYPNHQLKMKMEERFPKTKWAEKKTIYWFEWNVIEYYYPDGKPYIDWGTFKDGVGNLKVLDANGKYLRTVELNK